MLICLRNRRLLKLPTRLSSRRENEKVSHARQKRVGDKWERNTRIVGKKKSGSMYFMYVCYAGVCSWLFGLRDYIQFG